MPAPLAYFITFTTYGTRLSGDERGSVDRRHNRVGAPRLSPDERFEGYARKLQSGPSVVLGDSHRRTVDAAIREHCAYHGWTLHALNVRTNHVHVVVCSPKPPELVMNSFKACATRRLRERGLASPADRLWTRHGSTRYIANEASLDVVCDYTLNRQ